MTRFKKCDYCKATRKDIKKYKTGILGRFGENLKSKGTGHGPAEEVRCFKTFVFLCDMCIEFLVPEEHRQGNVISEDFIKIQSNLWSITKRPGSMGAHY